MGIVSYILPILIFVAMGLFMVYVGWLGFRVGGAARQLSQTLYDEGVLGDAVVTAHDTRMGRRVVYYNITYEYTVTGKDGKSTKLTSNADISRDNYDQYPVGETIKVRYLPDTPDVVEPAGDIRQTVTGTNFQIGGIITMVAGLGLIAFGISLFFNK